MVFVGTQKRFLKRLDVLLATLVQAHRGEEEIQSRFRGRLR